MRGSLGPSLDLIKARRKVGGRFCLGADRVEVGCRSILALWKGNELMASALDDGKRNEIVGHCWEGIQVLVSFNACFHEDIDPESVEIRLTHFCFLLSRQYQVF